MREEFLLHTRESCQKLSSIRVLILKEEGERKTKHENSYSLREGVGHLWYKVGMEIKHKYENAKSIRELSLNHRKYACNMAPKTPFLYQKFC